MQKIRWGILATGRIAHKMAAALHGVADAELVAVASRSQENADKFGAKWNIGNSYVGYENLAADANVDIVYIATPHALHAQNMKMCLSAGKHVLCEKPLTIHAAEADECIAIARQQGVFLMEAVWMRFFPAIQLLREWIRRDLIGRLHWIQADFCLHVPFDPAHRIYDPALGGGALLDLGIYPISLTTYLCGFPDSVSGTAQIGTTGVDELNTMVLNYKRGITAQLASATRAYKPHDAFLAGSGGHVHVYAPFHHPTKISVHRLGHDPESHVFPYDGNGFAYEIEEVHRCLRAGLLESPVMTLDESLRTMQLMDQLRHDWGVVYPMESAS